jgi:hypothetical protein
MATVGVVAAGGVSLAILVVTLFVASTPDELLHRRAGEYEGPEASAIRSLIAELEDTHARQRSLAKPVVISAVAGAVTGVSGALFEGPSNVTIDLRSIGLHLEEIVLGWNVAWFALGSILGLATTRSLVGGGTLAFVLIVAGFMSQERVSTVSPSRLVAAIVLGCSSLMLFISLAAKVFSARKTNSTNLMRGLSRLPIVFGPYAFLAVLTVPLALGLLATALKSNHGAVLGLTFVFAVIAILLAERIATLLGVTANPSSAMGLLIGGSLVIVAQQTHSIGFVLCCVFVVSAASAAADLAQDLLTGRMLGTSLPSQARGKWLASMASIPIVVVVGFALLSAIGSEYPAPQARALFGLATLLGAGSESVAPASVLVVGGLLFVVCMCVRANPIVIGLGMLIPFYVSFPMFLGAAVTHLSVSNTKGDQTHDLARRAAMPACLGAYAAAYGVALLLSFSMGLVSPLPAGAGVKSGTFACVLAVAFVLLAPTARSGRGSHRR